MSIRARLTLKIPNLRWWIAGLVFLNSLINYLDRQTLSIVAPRLTNDLHMTNIDYGFIVQAFLIAYTAMYLVSGILIDRWGVKVVFGLATTWWSIAEVLHALARTPFSLGVCRLLLGVGESAGFIAASKIASEWYPPKDRGTMNGIVQAAAVIGAILTPPIVLWLMLTWNWRVAFVATGLIGFLWVFLWWIFYDKPEKNRFVTESELRLIGNPQSGSAPLNQTLPSYWALIKMPTTIGLLLARIFPDAVWWFYLFWLPKYLTEARSLSLKQMGLFVWIPYLASDIGAVAGGWLSGVLIARKWPVLRARLLVMLISVLIIPLGVFTGFVSSAATALMLICLVLLAHMSWKTNLATLTNDLYPTPVVGRVAGIVGTGSGAGGAFFTSLAGYVIATWSYKPVFIAMGFLHLIGFAFVYKLVKPIPYRSSNETAALSDEAYV